MGKCRGLMTEALPPLAPFIRRDQLESRGYKVRPTAIPVARAARHPVIARPSAPFRNQIGRSAQRLTIKGPRKFIEPALVLTVRVQLLDTAASTGTKFHCTNFTRRKRWD